MSFFQIISRIRLRIWISLITTLILAPIATIYVTRWWPRVEEVATHSFLVPLWWLILTAILLIAPLNFAALYYQRAHRVANSWHAVDNSLLRLIPELISTSTQTDANIVMDTLIEDFLDHATQVLPGVHRGSVLLPDPEDPDHLHIWKSIGMTEKSINLARFYIGQEDDRQRGCAGKTFKDRNIRIVQFSRENGKRVPDHHCYKELPKRSYSPISSFAVVPMVGNTHDCIGVLCIDSINSSTFNSSRTQLLLLGLGNRIAVALEIYQNHINDFIISIE